MNDAKILLEEMLRIKAITSPVILCNPKNKKDIEEKVKQEYPEAYLIEQNYVKPNTVLVVKDLELKKALIEAYENKKQREGSVENG